MIKSLCGGLLLLGLSLSSWADTLKSEVENKQFGETVMTHVANNNLAAAFTTIQNYTVLPESEVQGIALQTKSHREQFAFRYGQVVGYELVNEKKSGESLLRLIYVEKTSKTALPWIFYFYKTPDGWMLNTFYWNDNIQNAFVPQ